MATGSESKKQSPLETLNEALESGTFVSVNPFQIHPQFGCGRVPGRRNLGQTPINHGCQAVRQISNLFLEWIRIGV